MTKFAFCPEILATQTICSSPRLVLQRMEELIVWLLLVVNEWRQKESLSFLHLLCSGMVDFGLRPNFVTAGKERPSPRSSPMPCHAMPYRQILCPSFLPPPLHWWQTSGSLEGLLGIFVCWYWWQILWNWWFVWANLPHSERPYITRAGSSLHN